ncbi:MAG: DNA-protecting protein DprA [Rhodobiaceae bacterium]|nr:DNA-processing protein DprA [Rhodobiaceae bacterium]MCC0056995.1 DNA-protecting protein DprA [Rhodobiaceae bacterium]
MDDAYPAGPIERSERCDRIRLYRSENVGPTTFAQLLARFGSAGTALDALPELSRRGGLSRSIRICTEQAAERELADAESLGLALVVSGEDRYPPLLRHADGAPPFLYVAGNLAALGKNIVAIVGARNASAAGRRIASDIASGLGAAGLVVASGLARGIDTAAHQASLATGTVAVLAGGLARIYPPENEDLADRIKESGALVSEMPPSYEARARDFPRRNRIVSALGLGVVVIEAAARSGSLITARLAGEQGRDLFAVPGSPLDPRSEGTNRLIREGATLVRHAGDILEALEGVNRHPVTPPTPIVSEPTDYDLESGDGVREAVAVALSFTPVSIDEVARQTDLPVSVVQLALTELELAGRASRLSGGMASLKA